MFKQILHGQIRVFADHVVESSEVTTGITSIGNYELHDLVVLEYDCRFSLILNPKCYFFLISFE